MAIFFKTRTEKEIQTYQSYLQSIGALSNLFSDSPNPFLYYRVAERIFCDSFGATNVSRSDLSVDAIKNELGIGLKTFTMGNGKTFQKIAEFNADSATFKFMKPRSLINEVARMRNERINLTHRTFEIKESIYHCVVRDAGRFIIFEEPMNLIDVNSIRDIKLKSGKNSISFHDKHHE